MVRPFSVRESLEMLSNRWRSINGIPYASGLYLTLVSRTGSKRQARSDLVIHRRATPPREEDSALLSDALARLQAVLITDIDQRRLRLALRRPDRSDVNGNSRMGTLRMLPVEIYGEREDEERYDPEGVMSQYQDVVAQALTDTHSVSPGRADEVDIAKGAVEGIVEFMGKESLIQALAQLGF